MPPAQIFKDLKTINTPAKCIQSDTPTLGQLARENGEEMTEGYICLWIAFIQDMVVVKNKMNNMQIQMCAQMVFAEFKQLKISDINLISQMAIRGEFGMFYESISIPKVLEWFRTYFDHRSEVGAYESNKFNETGQTESSAQNVVSALVEVGVIDQNMIDLIAKNCAAKEDEFRKVNAEYHATKMNNNE